ncbi:MAG: hypothetical protein OHK93_008435 [Ramalina farinacea]|uniref:Uncharacterized protein n=1 Tax=Ramalina farinacea TaxID=258253 RepID=A0AA43QNK3_9LECA|nr:hypothetical protein [Ramalina farinacea]
MADQGSLQQSREEKEQSEPTHVAPSMPDAQPRFEHPAGDLPYGRYGPIDSETRDWFNPNDLICSDYTIADFFGGPPAPERAEGQDPIAVHNTAAKLVNIGVKAMDQKLEPLRNYRTGWVALFPRDGNAIKMLNNK